MSKKGRNQQQAFTFVEVLVATLLTAIVMTSLGSMMVLSMRVAEANEMEQLAQLKAQQVMEFFRRERLIRGWNTFYGNLEDSTYCVNELPSHVRDLPPINCDPDSYQDNFNLFFHNIEANISKIDLLGNQSVEVEIKIFRYTKDRELVGDDSFFTVSQIFKQY